LLERFKNSLDKVTDKKTIKKSYNKIPVLRMTHFGISVSVLPALKALIATTKLENSNMQFAIERLYNCKQQLCKFHAAIDVIVKYRFNREGRPALVIRQNKWNFTISSWATNSQQFDKNECMIKYFSQLQNVEHTHNNSLYGLTQ
jgi:hypothetical protein